MKRKEVDAKVVEILVDKLGVDTEEAENEKADLQDDLGADSLDTVELIMEFEKEFNIGISDDDAEEIHTVRDIIDYIYKRVE
jgi:acyl carrier protein